MKAMIRSLRGLQPGQRVGLAMVDRPDGDTHTLPVAPMATFEEGETNGQIVYIDLAESSKVWFVPHNSENTELLARCTALDWSDL